MTRERERERRKEKPQEVNDIFIRSLFCMWLLLNLTFLFNVKRAPFFATSIDTHQFLDSVTVENTLVIFSDSNMVL
jgi:hypothetical protein